MKIIYEHYNDGEQNKRTIEISVAEMGQLNMVKSGGNFTNFLYEALGNHMWCD